MFEPMRRGWRRRSQGWNQTRRHRDQLFGADVDVFDLFLGLEYEVAGLPRIAELGDDAALLIQLDVGLGDDVFTSSHAERYSQWASYSAGCFLALSFLFLDSTSTRVSMSPTLYRYRRGSESYFIGHYALNHLAVGALDKAVFVDARKAGERRNETDVRTFGRLDGQMRP